MKKTILVSSNCQTEGIAEALSVMLPEKLIIQAQMLPGHDGLKYLEDVLTENVETLVTSNPLCFTDTFPTLYSNIQVIKVPQITFSAFHPDLVYACAPDGSFIKCLDSTYHSALCLWAWKNNLPWEDTIKLFNKNTFYELGYLNSWEQSVKDLKNKFASTKLDFNHFWRAVKRSGLFMHSIDHPSIFTLSELTKQIAILLGADQNLLNEPTHRVLSDRLTAVRWPIYPDFGERFGLVGMYKWKIRKKIYCSLEEYTRKAFDSYNSIGFKKDEITFFSDGYESFDKTLRRITS